MTEPNSDSLSATGKHRAWIGERLGESAAPLRANAPRDAARTLTNRPQETASSNARHAAITKRLSNFPSYKSWAEKAKSNWQKDKPE
jgi:hypothetical protein